MEESTKPRSVLYITANDAMSYARRCCDHGDQEGETMALKHAVELVLDLLEVKVLTVDSAELAKLGQPAEDGGEGEPSPPPEHFEMPVRTGLVAPSQGTGTIGHNPKSSSLKKFELSRKDEETGEYEPFAEGTAAELAAKAGVNPVVIYKQAQTRRAFKGGTWKVRSL